MRKIVSLVLLASSCTAQPTNLPVQETTTFYQTSAEEAHRNCIAEAATCSYDLRFNEGMVSAYKCQTKNGNAIYTKETVPNLNIDSTSLTKELWYETKLRRDISEETFRDICKTSFEAYKWFREEIERNSFEKRRREKDEKDKP